MKHQAEEDRACGATLTPHLGKYTLYEQSLHSVILKLPMVPKMAKHENTSSTIRRAMSERDATAVHTSAIARYPPVLFTNGGPLVTYCLFLDSAGQNFTGQTGLDLNS